MKYLIFIAAVTPTFAHAVYHKEKPDIEWPEVKYETGACITPTNQKWDWFGETARVSDLVYGKNNEDFFYFLTFKQTTTTRPYWGDGQKFIISEIDNNTELNAC